MNKLFFRIGLVVSLIWGAMSSCTERIELDVLTQEPRLVVFGFVSNRSQAYCVELSRTCGFFGELDSSNIAVSGAKVDINGERLEEDPSAPGKYYTRSDFSAQVGATYDLHIEVDFDGDGAVEVYESSTTMPRYQMLDSVKAVPSVIPMFGETSVMVSFNYYFQPRSGTYPGASFSFEGTPFVDRVSRHMFSPFGMIRDEKYAFGFPFFMFRPDYFTTSPTDTVLLRPGGHMELGLRSYSPDLFEFVRTAKVESNPGNPLFSGPPANVPSNITNGAYGCFGAYSEVYTEVVLPWEEKLFQGKWGDRLTGMVIEVVGNQAIVVKSGLSSSLSKGDLFLKDIDIALNNPLATCKILEWDGFQPERINWHNYFNFQFIRNGGLWIRL